MAWSAVDSWLTAALAPSLPAIIVTALIALLLPLLVHVFLYRAKASIGPPSFLLVGPSGGGKTSLLTLLERGTPSVTHISQKPLTVEVPLPTALRAASSKYRSVNDTSLQTQQRFLLTDTPGHGKLRHHALDHLARPHNLRGIIFLVDAANLSSASGGRASEGLTEAAEYLHDVLLTLQQRYTKGKSSKAPKRMPVLIAANKMDLFTALPERLVLTELEAEITKVRDTRAKGLLDSGTSPDHGDWEEDRDRLGEGGEDAFTFQQMEQANVPIEVIGGNLLGGSGADVDKWWDWIARHL